MHNEQLIQCPTRVTCSTASLVNYILASFSSVVTRKGVINLGLPDHQLTFCTRNISKFKTGGVHKYIISHLLKNYRVKDYKKSPGKLFFPNYKIFDGASTKYSDFPQKIMTVINNIFPYKTKRVKRKTKKIYIPQSKN